MQKVRSGLEAFRRECAATARRDSDQSRPVTTQRCETLRKPAEGLLSRAQGGDRAAVPRGEGTHPQRSAAFAGRFATRLTARAARQTFCKGRSLSEGDARWVVESWSIAVRALARAEAKSSPQVAEVSGQFNPPN